MNPVVVVRKMDNLVNTAPSGEDTDSPTRVIITVLTRFLVAYKYNARSDVFLVLLVRGR